MVRLGFMSLVHRYATGCVTKTIDSCIEQAATSCNDNEARPIGGPHCIYPFCIHSRSLRVREGGTLRPRPSRSKWRRDHGLRGV